MYDKNNIFYKLINKEIECKKIHENDYALSFYDIYPKARIHFLVIPKGLYTDILDFADNASKEEIKGFYEVVKTSLEMLNIKDGFKTQANTGQKGGQEVFHFHLHILAN